MPGQILQGYTDDLLDLMRGKEQFVTFLDEMYATPLEVELKYFFGERLYVPDHSGNVGQYAMGNEPGMFIPNLYNCLGQAWKTRKRVRTLMDQWFRNDVMGVPDDEDGVSTFSPPLWTGTP